VFVEVSYDVGSAVDERRCLVLFVWSNAITESGHGVLVYNARATLVLYDVVTTYFILASSLDLNIIFTLSL